jgi:hypothetical protein
MSGETDRHPSGWTVDTLKEHFDQRFRDQEKSVEAAVAASDKATSVAMTAEQRAVAKAEAASEKRFESVNEFRQTLTDQATTFMPRAEAHVTNNALAEKVDILAAKLDKLEGRSTGVGWVGALVAGGVAVLGTIIVIANLLTGS